MKAGEPFLKDILLDFKVSEKSLESVQDSLSSIGEKIKLSDDQRKSLENLQLIKSEISELQVIVNQLEETKDPLVNAIKENFENKIREYQDLISPADPEVELSKKEMIQKKLNDFISSDLMTNHVIPQLKSVGRDFISDLNQMFEDAWDELNNMIGYSMLSNAETRNLAFTYGFSGSQAYGYQKAMGLMGFRNEEDLMYATNEQLTMFKDMFEKYSDKYERLYDSGLFKEMYQYQIEMQEFKEDLQMEVIQFYVDNKDVIKQGMEAILYIAQAVLSISSFLLSTHNSRISSASDTISSYSTSTTNISVANTFNGIDAGQQANLSRIGAMTTEQIAAIFK